LNSFSWERSVWISELDKLFNSGKEDGIDPGSEDGDPGIKEEEEEEEEGEGENGLKVVEEEEEEEVNGFVYEVPKEEGGTELLVGMDDELESEGEGEGEGEGDGEKNVGEGVDADVESER